MKRADIIGGSVLFVVSVLLFYASTQLQMMYSTSIPGTGFLPFWLSLGMIGLSLLLVINAVRRRSFGPSIRWPSGLGLKRIAATIIALCAYTVLIGIVGYILSTFALVAVLVRMLSPYRWHTVAMIGLGTALSVYAVFALWLEMELPTGFLIIP